MASGTITLTRSGSGYLTGRIVWSSVSNGTEANTSGVTASLQLQRSAQNATSGTFSGTFTVGGVSETLSWYGTLSSYTWVTVKTLTVTVRHNADGSGNCYLYAAVNGPAGTSMEGTSVSGSATVTLDKIPRFATLVSVTDFTDEGNPVLSYTNPAGTAVDSLKACISLDGETDTIPYRDVPKTGTSYIFSLTVAERNTLRAATPNSNTLGVYVFLRTVIGSSASAAVAPATMRIVNAAPTISPTVTDTNSVTKALTGDDSILVARHSTASVTINAAAKKSATIKSRKVVHGKVTLTGNGTLSPVTNHTIEFTVTDSRGNTTTKKASNTIIAYFNPTCSIGNNIPGSDGSLSLTVTGLFYNGSFGSKTNALTVQYRYKASGGSYGSWTTISSVTKSGNSYTASAALTGLNYKTAYTFQARVLDSLVTSGVTSTEKTVIAKPVFDWGQNDFRFNVPINLSDGCDVLKDGAVAYYKPYGTRNSSSSVTNFDAITALGSYWIQTQDMVNGPFASTENCFGVLEVVKGSDSTILQRFTQYGNNGIAAVYERDNVNGWKYTWTRTDSVPINMTLGVEYLTREKHNGLPVYAKLLSLGTLSATAGVTHTGTGISVAKKPYFIYLQAYASNGTFTRNIENVGSIGCYLWQNGTNWYVNVTTESDASAYSGRALIKYVYQ